MSLERSNHQSETEEIQRINATRPLVNKNLVCDSNLIQQLLAVPVSMIRRVPTQ